MKAQPSKRRTKNTPAISKGCQIEEYVSPGTVAPQKPRMFNDLHAQITVRAYYLYMERGRREGCAEQDWLDAEREILNRTFPV
jgi:Protein of unknown function (DUF2934)